MVKPSLYYKLGFFIIKKCAINIEMKIKKILEKRKNIDLTTLDIPHALFYLGLPIVFINLLNIAYNLADTFWLGRLSEKALAAITFSFPLIFLFISLGLGFSIAGSILVAQNTGAGNKREVSYAGGQAFIFSIIISLILGIVSITMIEPILRFLGASPEVMPLGVSYMKWIIYFLPFLFGFAVFVSLMRGHGDTFTPMLVMTFSVILNIILDPILIFGWWIFPALGIEGAAIATIFCRGIGFLMGLFILFSNFAGFKIYLKDLIPNFSYFKKLLRVGIPASIETTSRAIFANAMLLVVGNFSTEVVAGYGIGIKVFSMVFLPALAVSRSVETITGQNIGACNFKKAKEVSYLAAKFMFLLMTGLGVVSYILAPQIISVFTNSQEVINTGAEFLKYISLTFGFIAGARIFGGGFRGAKQTTLAAMIAFITMGIIRFPVSYFLSPIIGPKGIWIAFATSNIVGLGVALFWFKNKFLYN